MLVNLYVEMPPNVDSKIIWNDVEIYGVNVTDVINMILIYGQSSMLNALEVLAILAKYGDFKATITTISHS